MKHDPVTTIEARSLLANLRALERHGCGDREQRLDTAVKVLSVVVEAQLLTEIAERHRIVRDEISWTVARMKARMKILELLE